MTAFVPIRFLPRLVLLAVLAGLPRLAGAEPTLPAELSEVSHLLARLIQALRRRL